jgi:hypothetical protein
MHPPAALLRVVLAKLLISSLPLAAAEDISYRITAAHGPYFVCDRRVVEDYWGIERFVVPLSRHAKNPLMVRAHPWEGTGPHMGGSVLRDPDTGRFRMWYSVFNRHAYENKLPFSYNVCYAESDDGLAWRRPMLGVFDYQGSTSNNCIRLGTDKTQNIDVCLNPTPGVHPGRFLAIHNQRGGVFVSTSDDGVTFRRLVEQPAISYHSDTHNNFVFDESSGRWLLFCRPRAYAGDHKRRVSLQTSPDLRQWTHERTILVPTETEAQEYYGMAVFRRGDLFFGVVQIYDRTTGLLHAELAWSGGGENWDLLPKHPPLFAVGEKGAWDAGMVLLAESPVVAGDELWFYYGGFPLPHDTKEENVGAIGLATAERDRLIGVRPRAKEAGTMLTRPFVPGRNRLTVNVRVRGRLTAELRTDNNKPVSGYTLTDCEGVTESGFAREMRWKGGGVGDSREAEVRILFRLEDADLFTFSLEPAHAP